MVKIQHTIHPIQSIDRATIVEAARDWIGTPYHHQASCRGVGTDCLGLVRGIWIELYGAEAEETPGYTRDWAEATGTETLLEAATRHLIATPTDALSEGDVVVFRMRDGCIAKHAAIVSTGTSFIHAMEGVPVCEVSFSRWWRRRIAGVFSFPGLID